MDPKNKGDAIKSILARPELINSQHSAYVLAHILDRNLNSMGFDSHLNDDFSRINAKRLNNQLPLLSLEDVMHKNGIPDDAIARVTETLKSHRYNIFENLYSNHHTIPTQQVSADTGQITHPNPPNGKQSGIARVEHLAATAGLSSLGEIGIKAALKHVLPPVAETIAEVSTAIPVLDHAEIELQKNLITKEQQDIIYNSSKETILKAAMASLVPFDPGIASDEAVRKGGDELVRQLEKTGLNKAQAEQYRLDSLTASLDASASFLVKNQANQNDIRQIQSSGDGVPLSMALNVSKAEIGELGFISSKLGGHALQTEVARNPSLEKLAHLPPKDLTYLGNLIAAGIEPKVNVNENSEIMVLSQRPPLSSDPKLASGQLERAIEYIMQSGDGAFRASGDAPEMLKSAVDRFGQAYQQLAKDGSISKQDMIALSQVSEKLITLVEEEKSEQPISDRNL